MADSFPGEKEQWRRHRYTLQKEIGSGNFGRVFTAVDAEPARESERVKAIKFMELSDSNKREAELILRFKTSRDAAAVHVITTFDAFEESNYLCIVMEYCEQSLDSIIDELGESRLSGKAALDIFHQLVQGVQFIHSQGIVHRDIKPSNILLRKGWVKIADFGTSKRLRAKDMGQTFSGTPVYMSPEVMQRQPHDSKADIWALGCVLYELLTSDYAFDIHCGTMDNLKAQITSGKTPDLVTGDERLSTLFKRMMELDPNQRPSAQEILKSPCLVDIQKQVKTILLIGKTGSGKSSLGNLLANCPDAFVASDSLKSCTQENAFYRINQEHLILVDTVGTGDTHTPEQVVRNRIMEALQMIRGGVDAVLLCLSVGERLPNEPIEAFNIIKAMFPSNDCGKNGVLVFTNTEKLEGYSDEERQQWVEEAKRENAHLKTVIEAFSNRVVMVQNPNPSRFNGEEYETRRKLSRQRVLEAINAMRDKRHEFEVSRLVSVKAGRKMLEQQIEEERARQNRYSTMTPSPPISPDPTESPTAQVPNFENQQAAYPNWGLPKVDEGFPSLPPDESQAANGGNGSGCPQTPQEKRIVLVKMQATRVQAHEFFCRRKRCSAWNKLKIANRKDDLIAMLQQHHKDCSQCSICPMCKLEIRINELTEKEMDRLISLHEDEVKKMAPKGGGFLSKCHQQ